MASAGRGEPRCSFEIADKIVQLLKADEEARARWNTLLGRGISASMRDTFMAYQKGRRGEYSHTGAIKRTSVTESCSIGNHMMGAGPHLLAALSRAKVLS